MKNTLREDLILSAQKITLKCELFTDIKGIYSKAIVETSKNIKNHENFPQIIGGESNIEIHENNLKNHAEFMSSMFLQFSPEVLVDTISWVYKVYLSRNFLENYWEIQLKSWQKALKMYSPPELFSQIESLYKWILFHHNDFLIIQKNNQP